MAFPTDRGHNHGCLGDLLGRPGVERQPLRRGYFGRRGLTHLLSGEETVAFASSKTALDMGSRVK